MMRVVLVLMCFLCGSVAGVQAGPDEQVAANTRESLASFSYRSDHYRDPFVPPAVVTRTPEGSAAQAVDVNPQTVRVVGMMSSAQGHWAVLEFDGGERLIVVPGQIISAYSQIVERITEQGVTLSAIGETRAQGETTYWLDQEPDAGAPRSGGNS
ncbi:MAG: hypothetical protein OXI53_10305 [Nitrospira sp.]|nr:hypothetical protein [Nitrospira sp.]MDE0405691.1 hypothetical protein [Nitrospira sp.]MDE0486218.1 hypothetical protein [Nitrospira sp.]